MSDSSIQNKQTRVAPSGYGFEGEGELVPIAQSDVSESVEEISDAGKRELFEMQKPSEKEAEPDARMDSREVLLRLIRFITTDSTAPLQTGQRVHLLAYKLGETKFKTDAEFARSLNVSPARVSQIIKQLPSELSVLALLKRRVA